MVLSIVVCKCTPYYTSSMGMTQSSFFLFVPGDLDLWPPKFKLGRDFCTMHLMAKFHHPTFNHSEVIVRTNKLTDRRRGKYPPHFATLCQWVIHCINNHEATHGIYSVELAEYVIETSTDNNKNVSKKERRRKTHRWTNNETIRAFVLSERQPFLLFEAEHEDW